MIATIEGEFLSRREGKTQDGKEYNFTCVLTGDEVIRVYNYNPGAAVKRLDPVMVRVEQRQGKNGQLYYDLARDK